MNNFNKFAELVFQLRDINSSLVKENILRANDTPSNREYLRYAYSPYITFGIAKQVQYLVGMKGQLRAEETILKEHLNRLADRRLTGNAAIIATSRLMAEISFPDILMCIIQKDLRANINIALINKALPNCIPTFGCQLAISKMPKLSEIQFPIYVEPKLDGIRAILRDGIFYSRNGHEIPFFKRVAFSVPGYVLDGEMMTASGLFADISSAAKRETKHELTYNVFDCIPIEEFDTRVSKARSEERYSTLRQIPMPPHVVKVPSVAVHDIQSLEALYNNFVAQGYEGVILKKPNSQYAFKRNNNWLKLKPFDTVDMKIVGCVEGTGKYEGKLGAFVTKPVSGGPYTEIGSGFTDQQRHDWFHEAVIGSTIEVKYQEKTPDGCLRFPTFVRFRHENL